MRVHQTVEADADVVDDDTLAGLLRPGRHFPSVTMVRDAARLFEVGPRSGWVQGRYLTGVPARRWMPQLPTFYVHQLDREFFVSVSGGTVGLRSEDTNKTERTAAERGDVQAGKARYESVLSSPAGLGLLGVTSYPGDEELRPCDDQGVTVRGQRTITEWSRKSRAQMTRCLAELDYRPMFSQEGVAAMVTLTYPGDWEAVAPTGAAVKAHLQALLKRWARTWQDGATVPVLWKLELQFRGAPHFHLFAVPPHGRSPGTCRKDKVACAAAVILGRCDACGGGVTFPTWLSETWAEVVGSDDTTRDERGTTERDRHTAAGTGIDWKEGDRCADPKRLALYFTKHGGAAGGKEYQHKVPALWLDTPDAGPGRWWGYRGMTRVVQEVAVDVPTFVQVRRTLRRLSEAQDLVRTSRPPRGLVQVVDQDGEAHWTNLQGLLDVAQCQDGEWTVVRRRRRKVTRRIRRLGAGGLVGGFVCVNDGPKLAGQLSRIGREPERGGLVAWWRSEESHNAGSCAGGTREA